jgi:hypothetical protein
MPRRTDDALSLSEEILTDIELSRIPLEEIVLRCSRLARLLNDQEAAEWLRQELGGFDRDSKTGYLTASAWKGALRSGRQNTPEPPSKDGVQKPATVRPETVAWLESQVSTLCEQLKVAFDPGFSSSSQSVINPTPPSNVQERFRLSNTIAADRDLLQRIKNSVHSYVASCNYSLKFGAITQGIFDRTRERVDTELAALCPTAAQRFVSAYDGLRSSNSTDWSNAVHSCRRVLKDLADSLFPATDAPTERGGKPIDISADKYVNRLMCYVEGQSGSETYSAVVGSTLRYIGERLDALANAGNKGTHHEVKKDEAERYVIYTYLVVGDLLALKEHPPTRSDSPEPTQGRIEE